MPKRILGSRGAVLVLALLVVVGSSGAVAAAKLPRVGAVVVDTTGSINMTAVAGFHFSPGLVENLPLGATITVNFDNGDSTGAAHTFTILARQGFVFPNGWTNISTWAYGTGSNQGNLENVNSSGGEATTTFASPAAPGWYEFVCTQPGHFNSGMYGFVAFGEALPSNLTPGSTPTGPGTAVFIIVGTVVTLTVVAIVLGFVVGRRHGSVHEMPPERLGYPEPTEVPPASPPGTPPPPPS